MAESAASGTLSSNSTINDNTHQATEWWVPTEITRILYNKKTRQGTRIAALNISCYNFIMYSLHPTLCFFSALPRIGVTGIEQGSSSSQLMQPLTSARRGRRPLCPIKHRMPPRSMREGGGSRQPDRCLSQ